MADTLLQRMKRLVEAGLAQLRHILYLDKFSQLLAVLIARVVRPEQRGGAAGLDERVDLAHNGPYLALMGLVGPVHVKNFRPTPCVGWGRPRAALSAMRPSIMCLLQP